MANPGGFSPGPSPQAAALRQQLNASLTPEQQIAQAQERQQIHAVMAQAKSTLTPDQIALQQKIHQDMLAARQSGSPPPDAVRQEWQQFRASLSPQQQQAFAASRAQVQALHQQFHNQVLNPQQQQLEDQIKALRPHPGAGFGGFANVG